MIQRAGLVPAPGGSLETCKTFVAAGIALTAVCAIPAFAGPVDTDTWYNFKTQDGVDFGAGEGFAYNHSSFGSFYLNPGTPPWTFLSPAGDSILTVLDGGELGDVYNVWDFGTLIGSTSAATPDAYSCGDLPEPCLTDALMSKGFFSLSEGNHSITISILSTPYPDSFLSWFRVEDAPLQSADVPEPGTFALVGGGLLIVGLWNSRRRRD